MELTGWLESVPHESFRDNVKAIIVPFVFAEFISKLYRHAGYRFSGPTAAYGYRNIMPSKFKRIFILGPSHFSHLGQNCALTSCTYLQTPLGQLAVDTETVRALLELEGFKSFPIDEDEQEHSVAMHLPYVCKVFESNRDIKVVPIVVGSLEPQREAHFGQLLKDHLSNPENLFIISSDFCHWGRRFGYTYYDKSFGEIYKSIENLDHQGMKIIEKIEPESFTQYLRSTRNTICGRHPIAVLLNALKLLKNGGNMKVEFIHYAQSEHCKIMSDSSVSYATAVVQLT